MIRITWLGHATFELQLESGEVLMLDPWIEGNPAYPKGYENRKVDAIAVTHGHGDHLSGVVPLAKKFDAKVLAMVEVAGWVGSKGIKTAGGFNKEGTGAPWV